MERYQKMEKIGTSSDGTTAARRHAETVFAVLL
jgi:hypothetical protein